VSDDIYDPVGSTFFYLFVSLGTALIWFAETVATLAVMGGASRNFVRHLLFGDAISFRDTYRNVRERVAGLIVASSIIIFILTLVGFTVLYFGFTVGVVAIMVIAVALESVPPLAVLLSVIIGLATLGGVYWLFCLVASRFAYVPQVMLVEEQGVMSSISRSLSLASGNVKRFAALLGFTTAATYSALAILYIPLAWYAWGTGADIFGGAVSPGWYDIASQIIWQASIIVLSPVWMIGLCLLYVDERVRHEGYDIELMAARRLGAIPSVPQSYVNPLQPALGGRAEPTGPAPRPAGPVSTLGLK
jgi:hypothetical protein